MARFSDLPQQVKDELVKLNVVVTPTTKIVYRKDTGSLSINLIAAADVPSLKGNQEQVLVVCGSEQLSDGIKYLIFVASKDTIFQVAESGLAADDFLKYSSRSGSKDIFLRFNDDCRGSMANSAIITYKEI